MGKLSAYFTELVLGIKVYLREVPAVYDRHF